MKLSALSSMSLLRVFSGGVEIAAAILIYRCKTTEDALRINAAPAIVGPLIMIGVTAIGLISMSSEGVDIKKFAMIIAGAALILLGTR